jgi:hypothetical protein
VGALRLTSEPIFSSFFEQTKPEVPLEKKAIVILFWN